MAMAKTAESNCCFGRKKAYSAALTYVSSAWHQFTLRGDHEYRYEASASRGVPVYAA